MCNVLGLFVILVVMMGYFPLSSVGNDRGTYPFHSLGHGVKGYSYHMDWLDKELG